jgi:hypothetical protein
MTAGSQGASRPLHVISTTTDRYLLAPSSLQVNNLSTLLLNIRLLPVMLKTGKTFSVEPRLVVVASGMHYWTKLEKKVVDSPEPLKMFSSKEYCTPSVMAQRYPDTKREESFMVPS